MAFNPFHTFRKHQRVIFSVLTIACMFIFVFTWGVGDFSQRTSGWFGGKGKGEVVATVYGKKVTTGDLTSPNALSVSTQRRMASEFVDAARRSMIEAVSSDPRGQAEKLDSRLSMALLFLRQPPENIQMRMRSSGAQQVFQEMSFVFQGIQALQNELKNKDGKEDERKFVDEVSEALKIHQTMAFSGDPGTYFGATSSLQDLLDFKLWEHQAEKLGIVLTEGAVRAL